MKLFNTETKQVEELSPTFEGEVKMYCCGFTAYDYAHIGNFRPYIWQDVLDTVIRHAGYKLTHVMNITDVGHLTSDADTGEDKMMKAARRVKGSVASFKDAIDIARFYEDAFFQHSKLLNIRRPDIICRATEHIDEMVQWVIRLKETGYAYLSEDGNVYFDTSKLSDYGRICNVQLDSLHHGARVDVDVAKKNPSDFVVWFSKSKFQDQLLVWDTPLGLGYPGWHLECSVMASKYLGERIDIHCGGIDHVNVHHANEIAQSEAYFGHKWVNLWMHGAFINFNNEKIGKSLGNAINLPVVLEKGYTPEAYRHLILTSLYRKPMNFTFEAMDGSQSFVNKLNSKYKSLHREIDSKASNVNQEAIQKVLKEFWGHLENDLSTPRALATLASVLKSNELNHSDKVVIIKEMDIALKLLT
jgi:cysteinyl-tRNA synthetase